MDSITLSKTTIKAIRDYAECYSPEDDYECYSLEDVTFHQDVCDIIVDMDIYGHWNHWSEVREFIVPPNVEYFSEWVYESFEVINIVAYDQEGEGMSITNAEDI